MDNLWKKGWVSRGFLVPKPNGRWLLIDYRYVNTQLRGHDFPLLVIEDILFRQQGNRLWTLLDLEDGFNTMPLSEDSWQYTVFCTPWGLLERKELPMGIKVGTQAFERVVSACTKHLQHDTMPYIDDLLSGRRAVNKFAGRELDHNAMSQAHLDQVIALFETLDKYHLRVRCQKYHMFMTNVKSFDHILHEGKCLPAPSKVDAIRNWTVRRIQTAS